MKDSVKKFIDSCTNEVDDELVEQYKHKYKSKVRELRQAEKLVTNIKREIEVLYVEISETF